MKNSKFLDVLLMRAAALNEKKQPMTACALLAAALEFACGKNDIDASSDPQEIADLTNEIKQRFPDTTAAKNESFRLLNEASIGFYDNLHWVQLLHSAEQDAAQNSAKELTALCLLKCIFNNPGTLLSSVIKTSEKDREPDTAKTPASAPKAQAAASSDPEKNKEDETEAAENAPAIPAEPGDLGELTASVKQLQDELLKDIYGQDKAISVFTSGYFFAELSRLTDRKRKKPRATFLFAGPPGVGKTFLAEKAASLLGLPFRRYDMSEYSDYDGKQRFTGSDKVYANSSEGTVTRFVKENPRCVLLFDEIEKAHLHVIHLFLQILDAGHIRDTNGDNEITFTDAIMIFTTNAGRSVYEEDDTGNYSELSRKVILKAIGEDRNPTTGAPFFPAAICSRFASGNVVMFNHISAHHLLCVAENEVQKTIRNTQESTGLTIDVDKAVYSSILFAEGGNADARTIRSRAESFITTELFELFRLVDSQKTASSVSDIRHIHIGIDLPEDNPDILSLFQRSDRPEILIYGSPETGDFCTKNLPDMNFLCTQSREEACAYLVSHNVTLILCDILDGVEREKTQYLNLEDVVSPGRDFLKYILEYRPDLPTYLLLPSAGSMLKEEKISYLEHGVRGTLMLDDSLSSQIDELCTILHQQQSIRSLARASKVISFETAQTLSADGSEAQIRLFDFELSHAVDSGDGESMVDAISRPNVSFDDVIGADDAIEELKYFSDYLKNPQKYRASGLHMPRGILLYGPPGTGKTMLAKALAHEADVPFLQTEGNRFLKKYVGEGPEAVHQIFRTARKYAPAIIFIDEIDAVGKERTGSEFERTGDILTALLTEMDGFTKDSSKPVFVLAATNFDVTPGTPKSLDAALMRRFDRRIYVDMPTKADRLRYLKKMTAENKSFALSEEKLAGIADRSAGMSLAGLESVLDLASRMTFRLGKTFVSDDILDEAFEEFNSGERKSIDESTLLQTARHEAGHTILCWQSGQIPSYLTVVARGNHGGYMQHSDDENKGVYTKNELLQKIRTSLGGRAAEIVCYGPEAGVTTGASGDLRHATALARQIVCTFGMDDSFGLAAITEQELANGTLALEVRSAVNRILSQEMDESIRVIREYRGKLDELADELLRKNHLNEKEIREILKK